MSNPPFVVKTRKITWRELIASVEDETYFSKEEPAWTFNGPNIEIDFVRRNGKYVRKDMIEDE